MDKVRQEKKKDKNKKQKPPFWGDFIILVSLQECDKESTSTLNNLIPIKIGTNLWICSAFAEISPERR